jgi:hypothetical protein
MWLGTEFCSFTSPLFDMMPLFGPFETKEKEAGFVDPQRLIGRSIRAARNPIRESHEEFHH